MSGVTFADAKDRCLVKLPGGRLGRLVYMAPKSQRCTVVVDGRRERFAPAELEPIRTGPVTRCSALEVLSRAHTGVTVAAAFQENEGVRLVGDVHAGCLLRALREAVGAGDGQSVIIRSDDTIEVWR